MDFKLTNFLSKLDNQMLQIDIDGTWLIGRVIGYDAATGFIKVIPAESAVDVVVNLRHVTSIGPFEEVEGDN